MICGYSISLSAKIGFGTRIGVEKARIERAEIGRFNVFKGPFRLQIEEGANIVDWNTFECGKWAVEERFRDDGYLRLCTIGKNALITSGHFNDATGGFQIGDNSWIAGSGSQFWTHGAGVADRAISIGSDCYIGSAARFAPGVVLGNNCLVGLGSVVISKFDANNLLIGGARAKILKEEYDWKKHSPIP